MSHRFAIIDTDSEDSCSDNLSEIGSPDTIIENSSDAAHPSNDISKLAKDLARAKLKEFDDDDSEEAEPSIRRKPPQGRKIPSLYGSSSDDDDDPDGHESSSSTEGLNVAKAQRPKKFAFRPRHVETAASYSPKDTAPTPKKFAFRPTQDKTSSSIFRTGHASSGTPPSSKIEKKSFGAQLRSLSSLDDDSSSSSGSSDDGSIDNARKTSSSNSSAWLLKKSSKEYTIAGGVHENVPDFSIPAELFDKLYDFQKDGVAWMAGLHVGKVGGILGKYLML
jgi:hypothetical protein